MPTFSRPSVATFVALVVTLVIGSQTGLAASSGAPGSAPPAVSAVEVTAADASSVTVVWPPSRDNWKVAGYGVFVDGAKVGTRTPNRVQRWRDRDSLSYTIGGLSCGRGYTVGVDVFDRDDDHSEVTSTTVSTSACPDTAAPSAPAGVRQVATTESSVVLAWTPSSDNVGVVEYGLYDSGLRVATVSDASATRHEPRLRQDLSARDRRGRRRGQPLRPRRLVLPHLRLPLDQQATVDPDLV